MSWIHSKTAYCGFAVLLSVLTLPVGSAAQIPIAAEEGHLNSSPNGRGGRFFTHPDGHLMYMSAWEIFHSQDGGLTWGEPVPMSVTDRPARTSLRDAVRLQSGKLGVLGLMEQDPGENNFVVNELYWWTSADEGLTWNARIRINPGGQLGVPYSGGALFQTSEGRLVLPVRSFALAHDGIREAVDPVATIGENTYGLTRHALVPEMETTFCYLSDDEGTTWFRSEREVFVWKDDGAGGMWPFDEPVAVELRNRDLLMFGRTTLGRIYQTISKDGGLRWSSPEPTQLASSYSPSQLVRLPQTGDLLCVWNQVSPAEIRQGFWRGRLSCAISKTDGATWENFQVIDVQGLDPMAQVLPGTPEMVRQDPNIGRLPTYYGYVHYPAIGFHGDNVIIRYKRRVYHPRRKNSDRMVILPVNWFYPQSEPTEAVAQKIDCEGEYRLHLQGVDRAPSGNFYWSFTDKLVKTDAGGRALASTEVDNHHGDLTYFRGKVYVAVNFGAFNEIGTKADSWVFAYHAKDLSLAEIHYIPQVIYGAGGLATDGKKFLVVGGLPEKLEHNVIYEYDMNFQFVKQHKIGGGYTKMGIQTASYANGFWFLGCYGEPRQTLVLDSELNLVTKANFDCAYGITTAENDKLWVARDRTNPQNKHEGWIQNAHFKLDSGLKLLHE